MLSGRKPSTCYEYFLHYWIRCVLSPRSFTRQPSGVHRFSSGCIPAQITKQTKSKALAQAPLQPPHSYSECPPVMLAARLGLLEERLGIEG